MGMAFRFGIGILTVADGATATIAFAPRCRRRLDDLVLKPQVRRAFWNGVDVDLTVGEFKIVDLLAAHVGRRVTYREIYDVLSECGFVGGCGVNGYRANVRSAIKRIRRKFEECDPTFDRIQNDTACSYVWARD